MVRVVRARRGRALSIAIVAMCLMSGGRPQAVSPDIVISQVYGGGGNLSAVYTHDFIELFNRGTAPVSVDGWSVQYTSASGTGTFGSLATLLTPLTGTIPAGGYLLVRGSSDSVTGSPLPTPDVTDASPINLSATSGKVALVNTITALGCNGSSTPCLPAKLAQIVDLVGYGNANFFEGSPTAPASATTSASRAGGGCTDTDNNSQDFTVAAPAPRNSASPLAPCVVVDAPPAVSSTLPANGATDAAPGTTLTVTFSEPVNVAGAWFHLSCSATGARTATVSGGPTVFTIDPTVDFASGESCTLTIFDSEVTDQDVDDPPDTMLADVVVTFTAVDACAASFTPIPAIQGTGAAAAITGSVTTRGVVVGDFEGAAPTLRGFYIQDPAGDGNPATSDGLFVFNGNADSVSLGDVVVVTGTAAEFQDQTQVTAASITKCGASAVAPVEIFLPFASASDLERFEGMLISLPQTLTVTEHFLLARFGEVVVSSGGRLRQPTDSSAPGAAAAWVQAQNDLNRLIIDDALNVQNPDPVPFARGGAPLSAANTLRGGDTVTGTVGVMTYTWAGSSASGNAFRVRPIGALGGSALFVGTNPRPAAPALVGSLRVASVNLLNFFNTFGPGACTNGVGGAPADCRGAANSAEFARQWPKTVAAIIGTGADIVGIVEIENDGYGPTNAIQFLVDRLNAATAAGMYAFIDADSATGQTNALGTDAIKVGILYKPGRVVAIGQTAALNSVGFVNGGDTVARNRPAIAQAFEAFATGARFVLSVNHLKSKGTACDVPDAGDGQGDCNSVRVNAATELRAWLGGDPTGIGDTDVLILGDLNAYTQEDPLAALQAAGFVNLLPVFGGGHSFAFAGQWGSLDHALASQSLRFQVAGASIWTINADEPVALDYNMEFKSAGQLVDLYAADAFRAADHNPLLVDLALTSSVDPTVEIVTSAFLTLEQSGGLAAGDAGSRTSVSMTARTQKGNGAPQGDLTITFNRTEADGVHTYQIQAASLVSVLRGPASGRATIIASAVIEEVRRPRGSAVVDPNAWVRITVEDNGEPGAGLDTVAITVLNQSGAVWFSSRWVGGSTAQQRINTGNVHVR